MEGATISSSSLIVVLLKFVFYALSLHIHTKKSPQTYYQTWILNNFIQTDMLNWVHLHWKHLHVANMV